MSDFFTSTKVANLDSWGEDRATTQMCKRPDTGVISELAFAKDNRKIELYIVTNGAVLNVRTAIDPASCTNGGLAFEVGVRADDSVLSDVKRLHRNTQCLGLQVLRPWTSSDYAVALVVFFP